MPEIFITRLEFDLELLAIQIRLGQKSGVIEFTCPRAFRVFDESDNYEYVSSYVNVSTLIDASPGTGMFMSSDVGYLRDYLAATTTARLDESNYSYILITPQECVEVIAFEDPIIRIE